MPITIDKSDEQPLKAFLAMIVMELGSSIERRDEHAWKAYSSMIVTEPGIVRLTSIEHPSNEPYPIEVIDGGMVIEVRVEPSNACLPIAVNPLGIMNVIPSCTPIR